MANERSIELLAVLGLSTEKMKNGLETEYAILFLSLFSSLHALSLCLIEKRDNGRNTREGHVKSEVLKRPEIPTEPVSYRHAAILHSALVNSDKRSEKIGVHNGVLVPVAIVLVPHKRASSKRLLHHQLGVVVVHLAAEKRSRCTGNLV